MAEKSLSPSTYEAYLVLEAESNTKYEYHNGFIVAMAGGTPAHSQIGANVNWAVTNALMENAQPCRVYNSDLKVRIESINRTYYPDASVGCDVDTCCSKSLPILPLFLKYCPRVTKALIEGPNFIITDS
ncbi:MAG: Uma2 family endonuclease [Bacteroidota bacterium]